ncbi:MAG: hypothetical protein NVV62_01295 [Terricaulis sp.]|nr:hypothetical protein [Terricaulis sp.]
MSGEKAPEGGGLPRVKGRLPFETKATPGKAAAKQGALLLYGLITAGLIGLALYNAFVEGLPLASPWVLAPAIASAWFALRLFMIRGSRG